MTSLASNDRAREPFTSSRNFSSENSLKTATRCLRNSGIFAFILSLPHQVGCASDHCVPPFSASQSLVIPPGRYSASGAGRHLHFVGWFLCSGFFVLKPKCSHISFAKCLRAFRRLNAKAGPSYCPNAQLIAGLWFASSSQTISFDRTPVPRDGVWSLG